MRAIVRDFVLSFLLGFVLPFALVAGAAMKQATAAAAVPVTEATAPAEAETEEAKPVYPLLIRSGEDTRQEDLEAYLVGVVLAEMPAYFEPEALKAQAVAARTYTARAAFTGGKHGDGSVCADPDCCQSHISETDYFSKGGTGEGLEKVRWAVNATCGLILTYEGAPAEATYFSCSGGRTEAAVAVWGTEYPYLKSVESPGEENAAYHRDTVRFSLAEFAEKLGIRPEGEPESWFSLTEYTAGGSVDTMVICGESYSGTQLRSLLGLRSAAFDLEVVNGQICITTRGWGHRVGMSQYGAEAMAVSGSSFADILSHYYPGTELTPLEVEAP